LAYALVRLGEAFLYTDTVVGFHVEVDRLREVQAALLGVPEQARRGSGPPTCTEKRLTSSRTRPKSQRQDVEPGCAEENRLIGSSPRCP